METTAQPEKQKRIYGILGTLAWMVVAFIGGIFVGMHQEWIPNMPWAYHPDFNQSPATAPIVPATQPTTEDNSTETPQTQPSPMGH
jgi:hypothetical protein